MDELLEHPVFDEEFKAGFDEQIKKMIEEDEGEDERLMNDILTTKDGRPELT